MYTEEDLEKAIIAVETNAESLRSAAAFYNIPISTLSVKVLSVYNFEIRLIA